MSTIVNENRETHTSTSKMLTVKELAELINASTTTVYNMVHEGQIPHVRVRAKILFHREIIESWLRGE